MKTYAYTIKLEPAEEGGYNVFVPALPGCVTQGETYEDAIAMAEDAIQLWLQALADDGKPIPEEIRVSVSFVTRVQVDAPVHV